MASTESCKFKNSKLSYIFKKTLVLSIICSKCENGDEKTFRKEKSIEMLKLIGVIKKYNYFKNMVEEKISQDFTLKKNELMSYKHKKGCATLNNIEHFLILAFVVTGFISISTFASLRGIPTGITSSAID